MFKLYFVSFLDILGFSNMVKLDCESPANTEENLKRLLKANKQTAEMANPEFELNLVEFSDSIVMATPYCKDSFLEFLNYISMYQYNLFSEGILCRGGVAYGKHFYQEGFMFSLGLIEAYKIESKLAKYPRIIVSVDLLDTIYKNEIDSSASILRENDNQFFIDYLIHGTKEQVISSFEKIKSNADLNNPSINEKIRWLMDYIKYKFPDADIQNNKFKKHFSLYD